MSLRPMFSAPHYNRVMGQATIAKSSDFESSDSKNFVRAKGSTEPTLVRLTLVQRDSWKGQDGQWKTVFHPITARVTSPGIIGMLRDRARGGDTIRYEGTLSTYEVGQPDRLTGQRQRVPVVHLSWIQILNQTDSEGERLLWDTDSFQVQGSEEHIDEQVEDGDLEEVLSSIED